MTTMLAAVIQLAADVEHPRRRGWRCTCRFEETVSRDGEKLLGVEISPARVEQISPGVETEVILRLWAPLSRVPEPHTTVVFYEGEHLVASGTTTGVIETESA